VAVGWRSVKLDSRLVLMHSKYVSEALRRTFVNVAAERLLDATARVSARNSTPIDVSYRIAEIADESSRGITPNCVQLSVSHFKDK